jgi:hypothetical protein
MNVKVNHKEVIILHGFRERTPHAKYLLRLTCFSSTFMELCLKKINRHSIQRHAICPRQTMSEREKEREREREREKERERKREREHKHASTQLLTPRISALLRQPHQHRRRAGAACLMEVGEALLVSATGGQEYLNTRQVPATVGNGWGGNQNPSQLLETLPYSEIIGN